MRRLEAALQSLDVAIQQRLAQNAGAEGLAEEVRILSTDRARLAESLDQVQARAARMENINRDVSRRLSKAVETIRSVLDVEGGD